MPQKLILLYDGFYLLSPYFVASTVLDALGKFIQVFLSRPFYRRGNWDTERVSKLPKVTQLVSKYLSWNVNPYLSNAKAAVFWLLPEANQF